MIKNRWISAISGIFLAILLLAPAGGALAKPRSAELVADARTGRILHGKNIYSLRHPASLTKVMTLYLTFSALQNGRFTPNTWLPVSARAAAQPPSKIGLRAGSKIRVRDAILALVAQSANDVAVVLAEAIGGTEPRFAKIMTAKAKALGMKRTVYRNSHGLPNRSQVTTAFDQAILARAVMAHFPQYYHYFGTGDFTYAGKTHHNHNRLMDRYNGMDGMKTGYINASGYNLLASAKRGHTRLIGIVFGGRSARKRDRRMAALLDAGFDRGIAEARGGKRPAARPVVQITADAADVTKDISEFRIAEGARGSVAEGDRDDDAPAAAPARAKKSAASARKSVSSKKKSASSKSASSKRKSSKKKDWSVQVGSYSSKKRSLTAIRKAKKNSATLRRARHRVIRIKAGRKTLYRARITGLAEDSARKACASLSNAGYSCLTLPPRS